MFILEVTLNLQLSIISGVFSVVVFARTYVCINCFDTTLALILTFQISQTRSPIFDKGTIQFNPILFI